jgi:cytoskeleton protein RodZ
MSLGLNAPFRDRPGRRVPSDLQFLKSPVVLGAAVLVVASGMLYLLPAGWLSDATQRAMTGAEQMAATPAPAPVSEAASASVFEAAPAASTVVVETVQIASAASPAAASAPEASASVPAPALVATPAAALPAATSGALLLRTSAESWVEVIDGRGSPLLSRMLQPGETVGLDGASPLRVKIGNASATQVSFRGRAVELTPTRDNVAKLELR